MKLKYKDIATVRAARMIKQNGCCALCGEPIQDDAVLDHDHKSGRIRTVLHRGCNALLGKLENNLARNKMSMNRLEQFSKNIVKYITQEYEDVIHPTYLTKEERKMKQAYKKKKKGPGKK